MLPTCLYFGCWNRAGHFLFRPGGESAREYQNFELHSGGAHLDGSLAPRKRQRDGRLCWAGMGKTNDERMRITYDSAEYPQGEFLRHFLDTGMTAIQWWDRTQGDSRGACNSTILLDGRYTADEMIAALMKHFPHVAVNLANAGVALVEVMGGSVS